MKTKSEIHISKLGLPCLDKVTGLSGHISSVSFDLYGCVQALVTPKCKKDGSYPDSYWLDINRLETLGNKTVIPAPNFLAGAQAEGLQGPAAKPTGRNY